MKIAETFRAALALTKVPPPAPAAAAPAAAAFALDTLALAKALGYTGRVNGGVYQVSVPRAEPFVTATSKFRRRWGWETAINFQPTGGGKAAITGDFVMLGSEVNAVIRSLRESGIEVRHCTITCWTEEPRLFFMHFWANDDAMKLARGLRAALEKTNSKRPGA